MDNLKNTDIKKDIFFNKLLDNMIAIPLWDALWGDKNIGLSLLESVEMTKKIHNQTHVSYNDYLVNSHRKKPAFKVNIFDDLKEFINNNMIYPEIDSHHYFIQLTNPIENPGLSISYNLISGGRELLTLTDEQMERLTNKCVSLANEFYAKHKIGKKEIKSQETHMSSDLKEQLSSLMVDGQKLILPEQQLSLYTDIKGLLTKAGGKYSSKGYFEFQKGIDVQQVFDDLLCGNTVNFKKDAQFFATPKARAERLCDEVGDIKGKRVLEPSAGDGAIADVARARGAEVVTIENWQPNVLKLKEKGYAVIEKDFLTVDVEGIGKFDAIIANPPFSKNQDIDHVMHMWQFLKPEGVLSSVISATAIDGKQKKQLEFQQFLDEHDAVIESVPSGEFKESGTSVATYQICVKKPSLELVEDDKPLMAM